MTKRIPHKLNAPGDFYVEDGCCVSCGIPESEAPELFAWEETDNEFHKGHKSYHCYVCRQPKTEAEIDKMISIMSYQELDCIRYKGNDSRTLEKIEKAGQSEYCDLTTKSSVTSALSRLGRLFKR
ncbi:MAG TPA: hypothetical protein VF268_07435 [Gammaproteobacteria bacterium]